MLKCRRQLGWATLESRGVPSKIDQATNCPWERRTVDFLSNIPISTTSGFIGLGLLVLGGFMILAGFDIIRIEKVTVSQGRRTWAVGMVFAAVGLVLLVPELTSAPEPAALDVATATIAADTETSPTEAVHVLGEWTPVDFVIPNSTLWRDTPDGIFTAIGREDAFAWSTEEYAGDLMLSLDLESPVSRASGCVVVYGDGQGFSQGSLIFCVDWDGYGLEKHTIYHEGENSLVFVHDDVDLRESAQSVTIEIIGDIASMYVNGERVLSTPFDTEDIDRSGRVALLKKWFDPEITFSNIRIRAFTD